MLVVQSTVLRNVLLSFLKLAAALWSHLDLVMNGTEQHRLPFAAMRSLYKSQTKTLYIDSYCGLISFSVQK